MWHLNTAQAIDEYCNKFENALVAKYQSFLFFKHSFNQVRPIKFCHEKGFKLDRVVQCELNP